MYTPRKLFLHFTFFLLANFFAYSIVAQGEGNIWYFGHNAGVTFNSGTPVALTNGQLHGYEGCATISDKYGNLLFYTDGISVWNKNHLTMPSGTGLLGDSSTTQTLIAPRPGSPNLYYIFAADAYGRANGLTYSIVDMTLNGGLGDITTKNTLIYTPSTEKIVATKHSNGCDIWVLTHKLNSNEFDAYLITNAGLSAVPVVSNTGLVHTTLGGLGAIGYMKFSKDGKRIALAISKIAGGGADQYDTFEVLDFDPSTGIVSNPIDLTAGVPTSNGSYGVEFSPDGTRLYVTCAGTFGMGGMPLTQFDLTLGTQAAINASKTVVGTTASFELDALQLGPDGKIYGSRIFTPWLGVINSPNTLGVGCNYVDNGVDLLGREAMLGLPNFIASTFIPDTTSILASGSCPTAFSLNDTTGAVSIEWNFGDPTTGANNTSTIYNPSHSFSASGNFNVQAILHKACFNDTIKKTYTAASCGGITVQSVSTNTSCNGSTDGTATATVSSGIPSYTYSWSSGGSSITTSSSYQLTNLGAGSYTITITDGSGTTTSTSVTITSPPVINPVATGTATTCNNNNGKASVTTTGGTGSYTYTWTSGGTAQTINGLASGGYTVTITDANGCTKTASTTIGASSGPTAVIGLPVNISCFGGNNGSATVSTTGGTANYTYHWSSGITTITNTASNTVTGLSAATYTVTVSDVNGCSKTNTIVLTSPAVIAPSSSSTPADCGVSNGSASVTATGGTGTYSYSWTGGATTQTVNGLASGGYTVTVTDANGCSNTTSATVTNTGGATVTMGAVINTSCFGGNNGSANVTASGGTPNYTYSWSNGANTITSSLNNSVTSLTAGIYTVTLTDGAGCLSTSSVTIIAPAAINPSTSGTSASCGQSNGSASVTVSGGISNYTYSWSNGASTITSSLTNSINSSSAGTYTVTVTDNNGCTSSSTVTILNTNGPGVTIQSTTNTCIGKTDGSVAVTVAGGSPDYTYNWSNGVTSSSNSNQSAINNLNAGTYTVTVTDMNGCTSTTTAAVTLFPNPIANAGTDETITAGQQIQLTAGTGVNYLWSPSTSLSNATIFDPLASPSQTTTYTLLVTDSNNCSAIDSVMITVIEPGLCDSSRIFMPTAFSPNGDTYNDILYVHAPSCIIEINLQIFDRWGQLVFTSISTSHGWDGNFNGQPMNTAVFSYYLNAVLPNGQQVSKKGNVTLLR